MHVADCDPKPDQRFTDVMFDPETSEYKEVDITDKVFYINAATGVMFIFYSTIKNDPSFGYGYRPYWANSYKRCSYSLISS